MVYARCGYLFCANFPDIFSPLPRRAEKKTRGTKRLFICSIFTYTTTFAYLSAHLREMQGKSTARKKSFPALNSISPRCTMTFRPDGISAAMHFILSDPIVAAAFPSLFAYSRDGRRSHHVHHSARGKNQQFYSQFFRDEQTRQVAGNLRESAMRAVDLLSVARARPGTPDAVQIVHRT